MQQQENTMRKSARFLSSHKWYVVVTIALLATTFLFISAQSQQAPAAPLSDAALLDGFRHVEVASASDAMEQLLGRKMYMTHQMRPIFPAKFAGFAVTVQLKKSEGEKNPTALKPMLEAIDMGAPNSVYVMVLEKGVDIAGIGGLMGTALHARGFSGAIIDGGVRDITQLQKLGFPVFAMGIVPSTSVTHYRAERNTPVVCDGVPVQPNDIIIADMDGVAVVPRAEAQRVLALAQQLDYKEHSMYGTIEQLKSIQEAVAKFGRL
jgi:regulator of RNase E activity RraA